MPFEVSTGGGGTVIINGPDRTSFTDNLTGGLQYMFANALYKVLEIMGTSLGMFVGSFMVRTLEILAPHMVDRVKPVLDEIKAIPGCPAWLNAYLSKIGAGTGEVDSLLLSGLASSAIGGVTSTLLGTALTPMTYALNHLMSPARPDMGSLIAMSRRGSIDDGTFWDWARDQGWPDPAVNAFKVLAQLRLPPADLLSYYYRTQQKPDGARDELAQRGMESSEIDKLFELSHVIPPLNDLIRMMVREAFRDDVAAKWRYDEDYPGAINEWAGKSGLSPDWAKKYWRAHWELPSPSMGIEMVRRAGLSVGDFAELLKIADYPAGWRDYMVKLIYEPFTRVDVRRMRAAGNITYEDVKTTYKQLGYDEWHATKLADWTENEYAEEEKEITKSDIIGGYIDGLLSPQAADIYLTHLEYPPEYRALLLARADLKKTKALTDLKISAIRARYVTGAISRSQAMIDLGAMGLPSGQIDILLEKWDTERTTKLKIPPEAKLSEMYFYETMTIAEYRVAMRELGYREDAVNSFTRLVQQKMWLASLADAEAARKEAERLAEKQAAAAAAFAKEQARIIKELAKEAAARDAELLRIRKAYVLFQREQRGAELRKAIAQMKLENIEAEMAVDYSMPEEQLNAIYDHIDENKRDIMALQVDIAALPLTYKYVPPVPPAL